MSSDLEQQLRDAFAGLPQAPRDVEVRARRAALATLPPEQRRRATLLVVALAAAGLLLVAAAALAASGRIHVQVGSSEKPRHAVPPPLRITLPPRAHGFAVVANGRLWLVTRGGARIEGFSATTAELSPRALYVAVAQGRSLSAMAPDGRHVAWARRMVGRVVAISWRPDGLEIAYVIARRGRNELRLIEGDGDHDRLLDSRVAAVKPTWRADSLSLAYVGGGGRPVIFDRSNGTRRVVSLGVCNRLGPVRSLAFGAGGALAFASADALWVKAPRLRARCEGLVGKYHVSGVGWLPDGDVASGRRPLRGVGGYDAILRHDVLPNGAIGGGVAAFAREAPTALVASPVSDALVVGLAGRRGVDVVFADAPPREGFARLHTRRLLLRLPARSSITAISWR